MEWAIITLAAIVITAGIVYATLWAIYRRH